jgi:predicted Rossmann fold flavoprotein
MMYDVIVIGAGAAGLMAAAEAGKRGRKVLLIEHTDKIGEKIRISGGGRCNFTNLNASPKNYISENPHFAISALSRYTQHDFIKLVESYKIAYHEKTLGQLFCDGSSAQIINMLVEECNKANVTIMLNCQVREVSKPDKFSVQTTKELFESESLIIATGGLSIPKLGATDFSYRIAKQFGLNIITPKPALVPLTVGGDDLELYKSLSGVSVDSIVKYKNTTFRENILFTHRGLSGPAILQISSYLPTDKETISMNLLPDKNLLEIFTREKKF